MNISNFTSNSSPLDAFTPSPEAEHSVGEVLAWMLSQPWGIALALMIAVFIAAILFWNPKG